MRPDPEPMARTSSESPVMPLTGEGSVVVNSAASNRADAPFWNFGAGSADGTTSRCGHASVMTSPHPTRWTSSPSTCTCWAPDGLPRQRLHDGSSPSRQARARLPQGHADWLGHSTVMPTVDSCGHVIPQMNHAAANLIAGLVTRPSDDSLVGCWPLPQHEAPDGHSRRSARVRREGLEPPTRGLRADRDR